MDRVVACFRTEGGLFQTGPRRLRYTDRAWMDVAAAVAAVLGSDGDETILEYVKGVLGDEEFEWVGENGESAYDAVGPFLVGCAPA